MSEVAIPLLALYNGLEIVVFVKNSIFTLVIDNVCIGICEVTEGLTMSGMQ